MSIKQTLRKEGARLVSTFYEDYRELVFKTLLSKVRNYQIAEDVTSNTFLKVARAISTGTYKDLSNVKAWVMKIAHNELINYFRADKKFANKDRLGESSDDFRDPGLNPLESLQRSDSLEKLMSLVGKLPEDQREVFILHSDLRLPFEEIAKRLGIPNNSTLRTRHRAAKKKLREMLTRVNTPSSSEDKGSS